ncbi:hypothetical protein D9613_006652 [Agrocybe pediades]|uniref:DNL-type domain-containing protein n=1 Tax=Agrocybe pediades TaxID=84607 RepID=A0A8H4QHZ9_9AGAR|nr:hypothetical protein D9613_006652 [Agrocybe pediades]
MLPSRLFRNTGIPPALRSLITPHASLPPNVAVQLRFRLGVIPGSLNQVGSRNALSTTSSRPDATAKTSSSEEAIASKASADASEASPTTHSQALPETIAPKLALTFTCTVPNCGERSTHQFTKHAYEKGVVLVQCPGCKNRHLIADHLGWFKDGTKDGKLPTIEDIIRDKGEKVRKGIMSSGGDLEFVE